jgi:hypothetical protein
VDTFVVVGVCIASIGVWLIVRGVYEARRNEVAPRDTEKWRMRAGKQSFNVPWNMPLDVVVAFVRAWRRQDAARRIGIGTAVFAFGIIVAVANAYLLAHPGAIVLVLYPYLCMVVLYPPGLIAAYLCISRLSQRQHAVGQIASQRPLRDYRHPGVPVLCVVLLLVYVVLLAATLARLTNGLGVAALAQVLAWPEVWELVVGLLAMLVAVVVTEVVAHRIVSLPPIPFPPANGWDQLASYVLRFQAISACYYVSLSVFVFAVFNASSLVDTRPIDQSGMAGWYWLYLVLTALVAIVFVLLALFHAPSPSPSPAPVDTHLGATAQPLN